MICIATQYLGTMPFLREQNVDQGLTEILARLFSMRTATDSIPTGTHYTEWFRAHFTKTL